MKLLVVAASATLMWSTLAVAQGTFLYDQQSSTDETAWPYGSGGSLPSAAPCGQSFTPTLSGINFIRLNFNDGNPNDGLGTSVYLNLRANSFTGTTLGTSDSVAMPNGFTGVEDFSFSSTIPLTPGTTYFFEIVETPSWVPWNFANGSYDYAGGYAYYRGSPAGGSDLWFREGLYTVPEPSAALLGLLGFGVLGLLRARRGIETAST
ncbi:MAG TPA: PEP-CTERM sorting domain-containing protein [Verrucomicrobiae bacterium]|nr:PEP-CTERM sorting domain-containing protein [Verrucomicrobiae bacterium]